VHMENPSGNLREIAAVFFQLGCLAFGGPAAHIAMMEREIVDRRGWMDHEHFLDLIGATNLIPGPNSTELTMHCGQERAGFPGLLVAGLSFILPSVTITGLLAFLYVTYGDLPAVQPFVYGIQPAVLAIISAAILKLARKALKNTELIVMGIAVLFIGLTGANEVLLLLATGILGAAFFLYRPQLKNLTRSFVPLFLLADLARGVVTVPQVFWSFLKVGALLYGSGYVLFAYLDAELVARGWLTRPELLDAIAVGQFTPGPVLSTATFVGYQLAGPWGAVAATVGIFLPSFVFVSILNPWVPRMRESRFLGYFLDSVNVAAVAVMAAVLVEMASDSIVGWRTLLIALLSFGWVFGLRRLNPIWVVPMGSVLGFILTRI